MTNDTKTAERVETIDEIDQAEKTNGTAQPETIDFAQVLHGRMATYQLLARFFRVEVDQDFLDLLHKMEYPTDTGNEDIDEGYRLICSYISHAGEAILQDLAKDYVRCFIGLGNDSYSAAYPYESVYTSPRRLMMQDARDEVLVIYRAAGLEKTPEWREGEDHISLELEYEQIMGQRALDAYEKGDNDACIRYLVRQRNFLQDHLCNWYPMMAEDLQKFATTDFYRGVGRLTTGFLDNDIQFLNELLEGSDFEDSSNEARQREIDKVTKIVESQKDNESEAEAHDAEGHDATSTKSDPE